MPDPCIRGSIARLDRGLVERGHIWVNTQTPLDDSLVGSEIIVANDGQENACYAIHGIEKDGDLYRIDCGDVCFVRRFRDPTDYGKGYVYNFEEGAEWVIPRQMHVDRRTLK